MRPLPSLLFGWILALCSGGLLCWSAGAARAALSRLPAVEARGLALRQAPRVEANSDAQEPEEPPAAELVDGAWHFDFALLEFGDYDPPDLRAGEPGPLDVEHFPAAARELGGQRVAVDGYMQATEFDAGRVKRFMLTRFPPGCCFGALPQYDEWIAVTAVPEGVPRFSDSRPVTVTGELEVGEEIGEGGFVQSLYRVRDGTAELRR